MAKVWKPTHYVDLLGVRPTHTDLVMLCEDGAAYTLGEWRRGARSAWCLANGEWCYQGARVECWVRVNGH